MSRRMSRIVLALVLSGAAGPLGPAPLRAQAAQTGSIPADSAGEIRPGDLVKLRIWREPDLSGDFRVDRHGMIVLPKLGPREVGGHSYESLRALLVKEYGQYLRNPSIDVVVLRRLRILGAVQVPGLYEVDPTMTVADAVGLAGGVSPNGELENVQLLRNGERIRADLTQRTRLLESMIQSGDELYVPEKNWFARNPSVIASAVTGLVTLAVTILLTR